MCTCLEKSEERTIAFLHEKLETSGKKIKLVNNEDSGYVNKVFVFGHTDLKTRLMMPFKLIYTPIKKDGTEGKETSYETKIFPSFCPFCGEKIIKDGE